MLELRQELLQKRQEIEEAWHTLHMNQVEFEENAANEQLTAGLEQLDDRKEQQIEDIDHALRRLHDDMYNVCESCGGTISEKRLEAIPWTARCRKCSTEAERRPRFIPSPRTAATKTELPPELADLSDAQLRNEILDAIRRDGRIPIEELTISCHDQVVRLEGVLPSERYHSHLEQIIYDVLGLRNVEDMINIDRQVWTRKDRAPGTENEEEYAEDFGEGSGTGIIDSIKEGKTIAPADEIIPEKRKKIREE